MGIVLHCLHLSKARSVEDCEMNKIVAASCLVAAACGQFVEPQNAKILKEQRFNAGDGRHGSAFAQEDGTVFREETTADGERIGQYSYIDNDGKTITVRYTAGKDGFRILEGAHVPTGATGFAPAPVAPVRAAPVQVAAPVHQAAPVAQPDYDYVDTPVDPNFNPFINPHDPTHRDSNFNRNGANFAPQNNNNNNAHARNFVNKVLLLQLLLAKHQFSSLASNKDKELNKFSNLASSNQLNQPSKLSLLRPLHLQETSSLQVSSSLTGLSPDSTSTSPPSNLTKLKNLVKCLTDLAVSMESQTQHSYL